MTKHFSAVTRARASLLTSLSFLIALAGIAVVAPAPVAQAAVASFACDTVYSIAGTNPHAISRINTSTGVATANGVLNQSGNVNALALPAGGGRYIYAFNRGTRTVLRFDAQTDAVTTWATSAALASNVVAGAIDPSNGIYYFAAGGSTWTVYAFNTTTNTYLGQVATITGTGLGGNGDLAIDSLGNAYLVTNDGDTAAGTVSRVNLNTGSSTLAVTKLADTPASKGQYASVAIDGDGSIVIGAIGSSANTITRLNPTTGAQISSTTTSVQPADFASCSVPSTATTRASLPNGRYAAGDQFTVSITGGGITSGNTGTTAGADTGVQGTPEEMGGPVLTTRGTTYTIAQAAAGTTNLTDYTTTWACVRQSSSETIASGTGQSGTFTTPAGTASDVVCTFTNIPKFPAIDLVKTASAINDLDGNGPDVGDTVVYGYSVTNTGTTPLTSVGVADTKAGTITCPKTTLAVGETMTCTSRTYTLTQADVDAGTVVAPATATGTSPTSAVVTDTESTTTPIARTAKIAIDQTASAIADTNGNGKQDAGDRVTYGHVVTNTGNATLTGVTVTDPTLGAITCPRTTLVPGESMTCTPKPYLLSQADVNAGSVATTATATGTPPGGVTPSPVTATDATTVPITRTPAIDLTLTGSAVKDDDDNGIDPGDTITYSFTVKNTGNVVLDPTSVTSPMLGAITCPAGALAPGATISCTQKSHAITQADIDAGQVTATATASGTAPNGAVATDPDAVTTPLAQNPSVLTTKTASSIADTHGTGEQDAGDKITYSFAVRNTGNVTLGSITVTDARIGAVTCPTGPLAPGATATCTAPSYTLTQADVDAGKVVNTAVGSGTSPKGVTATDDDTVTTTITQQPAVKLVKTAGPVVDTDGNGPDAGDTITYSFVVTNTGNVTLNPVTVTDQTVGAVTCPPGPLAPGASVTCTPKTHTLTQTDVDAGSVTGTATATGTAPGGAQVTATDVTATPIVGDGSIELTKTASQIDDVDGNGPDAGDQVTYGFVVTNTGRRTLNDVTVVDTLLGAVTCPAGPLAPGASRACSPITYTLTQDDVEAGSVGSPATATGTSGTTTVTSSDATATPIAAGPSVTIDKTASAINDVDGNGPDAGDTVTYSFTVKNTGTVKLSQVQVLDPMVGPVTCPPTTLSPGASLTCAPRAYTLTQTDVDAGKVVNTATVRATTGTGTQVTGTDSVTVTVPEAPAITVDLSAGPIADLDGNGPDAGNTIDYTTTVTNTGNVTLDGVTVTDPHLGPITCPRTVLAPGETMTCTLVKHTITPAEEASGTISSTATATGSSPKGSTVTDDDTETTAVPVRKANVRIDKSADRANAAAGEQVRYTLTVTNDGPSAADAVVVEDRLPSSVSFVAAVAPCAHTAGTVRCELGTLPSGTTRSVVVTVVVREPVSGAALVQHDLDIQKVEAQIDLDAGQTRSVTAQCAPGYVVTDGSGRVDHVDQGTGTLGSVRVTESYASDDRTWTVIAVNGATGRAQAKVFAVCVRAETEVAGAGTAAGAHSHPLVVSPVVTRTVPVTAGRTEVTLDCAAGTVPVVPGYRLTGAEVAVPTSYPAAGEGWTFAVDSATAGGTLTAAIRCLDTRTGDAQPGGGHAHDLDLAEVRRTVTVPAGQLVEVDLSCADDAKGIVAGWDLDPGLVDLGNDPRPKIRVFKLWNPTAQPLEADLFLLCLGSRTRPGDSSASIVNTARVSTTTYDPTPGDNSDNATVTRVEASTTPDPGPAPVTSTPAPTSPKASVAQGTSVVTTTVACTGGTTACKGTALLVAAKTQRINGTTIKKGTVLARTTFTVAKGKTLAVTMKPTAAGKRVLKAKALKTAQVKIGAKVRTVRLAR
jgi:uncharacterized repeat protein (TIGR01451 family)